jgi:hypothetical protein
MLNKKLALLKIVRMHKREAEQRFAESAKQIAQLDETLNAMALQIAEGQERLFQNAQNNLDPLAFNRFENWRLMLKKKKLDIEKEKVAIRQSQEIIRKELKSHIVKEAFFEKQISVFQRELEKKQSNIAAENTQKIWLQNCS